MDRARGTTPTYSSGMLALLTLATLMFQDPRLTEALALLRAYAPQKAAPEDAAVKAATELLLKAVPRLARPDHALHGPLAQLWSERQQDLLPGRKRPIHARDPLARVLVRFDDERTLTAPAAGLAPHAAAAAFPGIPPADAPAERREIALDLAVPGRHSLGIYARPGAAVTLSLTGDAPPLAGLRIRIGAHSDDIARRDSWPRMPRVSRVFPFDTNPVTAASAYGGLVYVEVPQGASGTRTVTVAGAVPAPWFVLGTTNAEAWRTLRTAPGPWAELATRKVILTVPSERVRTLDDPTAVLQFWDRVLDAAADLAGRPHDRVRPERYVADLEISAGAMHAGYPIMTHLDAAATMVDLGRMQQAPWGLFHELGHNHQEKDWTFAGTGEVTVNLFSLYLCETLCSRSWQEAWGGNLVKAQERLAAVMKAGNLPWDAGGAKADLGLRLLMYSQIQQAFGWDAFRKCFAEYRALADAARPKTEAQKRDQWLTRRSRTVGRDLGPFFAAWGVAISDAARAEVAALPDWMPAGWPAK